MDREEVLALGFRLTQSFYATALGVWCGASVMLGLTAASAFEVIPGYEPSLGRPPFDEPAWADRAPQVLAGAVVNQSLSWLGVLGLAALALAVASVVAQCTAYTNRLARGGLSVANVLRVGLLVILIGLVFYDRFSLSPAIHEVLTVMYDADALEAARRAARYDFDVLHARSRLLHQAVLASGLVALLTAPFCYRLASPHRGSRR